MGATAGVIAVGGVGYYLYSTQPWAPKPSAALLSGKTVNLIVPYAAGGGYDLSTRTIAQYLPKYVDGIVPVVLNKPGGEALLGPASVWAANPDGLTVCLANAYGNAYASMTHTYAQPFTIFDFKPLGRLTWGAEVIITKKDGGINTWQDFKKLGRPVKVGALGIGDESGIPAIMTFALLGIPFQMVLGYAGSGDVMAAVVRGDVDTYTVDEDTAYQYVSAGSVLPVLTVYSKKITRFPDVPALGELLTADQSRILEVHDKIDELGRLLIVHPNTPNDIYDAWQDLLKKLFSDPDFASDQQKIRSFKSALGPEMQQNINATKPLLAEFKQLLTKVYPDL